MFFTRRRWALRIIEEMDLPAKSVEATHLIDRAIWAAKQDDQMFDLGGIPKMDKPQAILMSGLTMVNNKSAINNTAKVLNVDEEAAFKLLKNMQSAALRVAQKSNFVELVEIAKRHGAK